jgi:hypothetical protein
MLLSELRLTVFDKTRSDSQHKKLP